MITQPSSRRAWLISWAGVERWSREKWAARVWFVNSGVLFTSLDSGRARERVLHTPIRADMAFMFEDYREVNPRLMFLP